MINTRFAGQKLKVSYTTLLILGQLSLDSNLDLCLYTISKYTNFEFDPNIDKTRNLDQKC